MRLSYGAFSMSPNGEPTRVSHAFVKKSMARFMKPHGRFAHCSCENQARTRDRDRQAKVEPSNRIFLYKCLRNSNSLIVCSMEARDQESNLYAYEMTPNPNTRGGSAVVDNGPSSGGEVSKYQIYIRTCTYI